MGLCLSLGGSGVSSDHVRPPFLLVLYRQYLDHQDSAEFIRRVSQSYASGTLQRLARHPTREVRRAAVLALGFLGDYDANHTMGCALLDDDRTVRTIAENGIRTIWTKAGNESERQELGVVIRLNAAQLHPKALAIATKLIERRPGSPRLGTNEPSHILPSVGSSNSIRDCHQALEINPYHFVAAASMGQSYLQLQNTVSALECFRRALRLNPDLEGVRAQVVRLTRMVEDNR